MRRVRQLSLFSGSVVPAFLVALGEARACPDCSTARVVRASVFDDGFWTHLGQITLPFLVLTAISVRLYRIGLEPPAPATSRTDVDVGVAPEAAAGDVRR